jgi:anti-anti-sigma regulatory factor
MPTILSFDGPLTVATAEHVRDRLLAGLDEPAGVAVDASGAAQVDLTFLQCLMAAAATAAMRGVPFAMSGLPSGQLEQALARAGLRPDPARAGDFDQVFWRKGPSQ